MHMHVCQWLSTASPVCVVPSCPSPVQCLLVWCVPKEGDPQLLALPGVNSSLALHAAEGGGVRWGGEGVGGGSAVLQQDRVPL
jgi:hypothetical protein